VGKVRVPETNALFPCNKSSGEDGVVQVVDIKFNDLEVREK
jgi:hypothetical protein